MKGLDRSEDFSKGKRTRLGLVHERTVGALDAEVVELLLLERSRVAND